MFSWANDWSHSGIAGRFISHGTHVTFLGRLTLDPDFTGELCGVLSIKFWRKHHVIKRLAINEINQFRFSAPPTTPALYSLRDVALMLHREVSVVACIMCGSCGYVIRLVPAFSRGLTSYPGAQFSFVEILTREDVPWSPWVVRSERQSHQCGIPPCR